ncbi:MAG: TatD family hydrolase [Bacteroidetes bacterium]|nr:TatD family hydrolase [Bacteroidota bacterium]
MMITDTHCHLYVSDFTADIEAVMSRAATEGVQQFFLPAIDSATHDPMIALEDKFPGSCHAMMGVHPCSIKEDYRKELEVAEQWLSQRKFAAVGEIGLDFYWDKTFIEQQFDAFRTQIEWSLQYRLPIVIHTRNAIRETIEVVKEYAEKGARGIFHCFGGTKEEADEITSMGFYLGIGGVLTYKKSGLAEVLEKISLEHLVLETDAPYLTPVPFRGKRNESAYLKYIVQRLAEVKNTTPEVVAGITTSNAQKIFGI